MLDAAGAVTDVRSGRKPPRDLGRAKQRGAGPARTPVDLADPLWDDAPRNGPDSAAARPPGFVPQMQPLGSGSDYTVFLDHLGVPAVDVGFSGRYGVYHSIYDNFTWMEKFGDPEFITHATAARLYTVIAMRAAAAEVVPLRFVPYGEALREHRRRPAAAIVPGALGRAGIGRTAAKPGRPSLRRACPAGHARSAASRHQAAALDRATDDLVPATDGDLPETARARSTTP